ncbi:MAG: mechanosensitive ion channel domain-containing protein [Pseudomonadota bacterium]
MEQLQAILAKFNVWGDVLLSALLAMVGGIVLIFLLYRLVSKVVEPGSKYSRVVKVFFGGVYAMILVITVLVAAEAALGYDLSGVGGIAMLVVIVGSVLVFFLLPFLPRLPFVPGDMVKIRDMIGTIDAITAYQVVIRTFDGQIVYMPTALAVASPIVNFSHTPNRRVELNLEVTGSSDIERARSIVLELMNNDHRTLADPAPAAFVTGAEDGKVTLFAFAWVANADWFPTRDALFVATVAALNADSTVDLALPRMELIENW